VTLNLKQVYNRTKPPEQYNAGKLDLELQRIEGALRSPVTTSDAMPNTGPFEAGDFVSNFAPVVAGGGGSHYIVLGWKRLTTGNLHVLNTDWVEVRTLTGT
jgi:hypothetical protein